MLKDVTEHPKKPTHELMSTILGTQKLSETVMGEMKRYGIAIKSFANALGMNAATFSLSLREPRHWFDANPMQKRCYYLLYLWLNLPQHLRQETFKQTSHDKSSNWTCPVETMPTIKALIQVFVRELNNNGISLEQFAQRMLDNMDTLILRNMILTPLPWEMMPMSIKITYAKIWFWLKQRASKRLAMLGMVAKGDPDTTQIAKEVLLRLKDCSVI